MDIDQRVTELLDRGDDLTPYERGELLALLPAASAASAPARERASSPASEAYQRGLDRGRRQAGR